jgi:hypothetical protein
MNPLVNALVFFTGVHLLIAYSSAQNYIEQVRRNNKVLPGDHWYRMRGLRSPRDVTFAEVFTKTFTLLWLSTLLFAPLLLPALLRH